MPAALPLRSGLDSQTLRRLARRCEDCNQSRRLLPLAAVHDGMSRTAAARIGGMADPWPLGSALQQGWPGGAV